MDIWVPISVERENIVYEGVYRVKDGIISVKFLGLYEETHLSGPMASDPASFARLLLSELVQKSRFK